MSLTTHRRITDARHQLLITQAKAPISWDTGAFYSHPHYNLNTYQTYHPVPCPDLLSKAAAAELLVNFLIPHSPLPQDQLSAISRVNEAWCCVDWDPSLVIKAMADLDTVFFHGRLKGNVVVTWAGEEEILEKGFADGMGPEEEEFFGSCQTQLWGVERGVWMCKVWLNADKMFDEPDPRVLMWETLLHELVHAYVTISCGPNKFVDGDDPHDPQFNYLCAMVDRRSMYHLKMPARPMGAGHTICLKCIPRPLMHGDEGYGKDEEVEVLTGQDMDLKWDRGVDEGARQSALSD